MKTQTLLCGCTVNAELAEIFPPDGNVQITDLSVACSHDRPLEWTTVNSLVSTNTIPLAVAFATAVQAVVEEAKAHEYNWVPHLNKNLFRDTNGNTYCLWVNSPETMMILWGDCPHGGGMVWHYGVDAITWSTREAAKKLGLSADEIIAMVSFD